MINPRNRRAFLVPAVAAALTFAAASAPAALAQSASGTVAAQQELRIQELEGQISALTGQVEQLSFQVRQLTDKLDRMASDTDFRLSQLEGGEGDGSGSYAERPAVTSGDAGASTAGASAADAATVGSATTAASTPGTGPKVLGTLSQSEYEAQIANRQASGAAAPQAATEADSSAQETAAVDPAILPGATPDEQYQYAFGLLRQNQYDDAEKALRAFVGQNPDHQLAGNANYWLGETYYVRGDYQNAAVTFAQGIKSYPQSGKAPDTMLKLGMTLAAMGQGGDACTAFAEVGKRYPNASDSLKSRVAKERQRNSCP
jgi:tol-pal system protein YbgF